MRCLFCKAKLNVSNVCPSCGRNIKTIKQLKGLSYICYNKGLEYANLGLLTEAINMLELSVNIHKNNVNSLNLLGLCYFHIGEYTLAFKQWIYSVNIKKENNIAKRYMYLIEKDKNFVKLINKSILGYNKAIEYLQDNNEKMAIMQLQKVIEKCPEMICATNLLALLKLKMKDYTEAEKLIKKVLVIDNENEKALKYFNEINKIKNRKQAKMLLLSEEDDQNDSYSEDKSIFKEYSIGRTVVDILIGITLGILVILFLILPAMKENESSSNNTLVLKQDKTIEDIKRENTKLQEQIKEVQAKNKELNDKYDGYDKYTKRSADLLYTSGQTKFNSKNFADALEDFIGTEKFGIDTEWLYSFLIQSAAYSRNFEIADKYMEVMRKKYPNSVTTKNCQYIIDQEKKRN